MLTPTAQIDHEVNLALVILAIISVSVIIVFIIHHHLGKRKSRKPRKH